MALLAALVPFIPSGVAEAQSCQNTLVANGDFSAGLVLGSMPSGAVSNWTALTGTPQVVTDSCDAPGAVQMWGNLVAGESLQQTLPGPGIEAGKTYRVTVCYRWLPGSPSLPPYVRFRLTAFAGAPGIYPPLTTGDVIGITPNTSSTAWITHTLPDWTAPADATVLAINPENDETQNHNLYISWGIIDGICLREVPTEPGTPGCFGDGSGTQCPCANHSPTGAGAGCLNTTGVGAKLTGTGVPYSNDLLFPSIAPAGVDTVTLTATGTPNGPGLLFKGSFSGQGIPFGDGLLCCGQQLNRIGVQFAIGNSVSFGYPVSKLSLTPPTFAGHTYCYQVWYRDSPVYCTPASFNMTNSYDITWLP